MQSKVDSIESKLKIEIDNSTVLKQSKTEIKNKMA